MTDEVNQEIEETPVASTASNQTPDDSADETDERGKSSAPTSKLKSEEEAAWSSLSGSSQKRFRDVINENRSLHQRLEELNKQPSQVPNSVPQPTQDVLQAAQLLSTQGNLATREEVNQLLARVQLDQRHSSLENKYSGADGRPAYSREEAEDYARRNSLFRAGNYDVERAYEEIYADELRDHYLKPRKSRGVITVKPTSSAKSNPDEPQTLDEFRKKLASDPSYWEKLHSDPAQLDRKIKQFTQE